VALIGGIKIKRVKSPLTPTLSHVGEREVFLEQLNL